MGEPRIEFQRAGRADASAVRDLTRAAYAKWVSLIGREPKPMGADYVAAVQNHLIDLLYVDGALAGLIEMIPEADHILIENVAVGPAFQGRGLGAMLMAHAEQTAEALGQPEVRLFTNKLFEANVVLYLKLGYRVDREETAPATGVAVYMSKRL